LTRTHQSIVATLATSVDSQIHGQSAPTESRVAKPEVAVDPESEKPVRISFEDVTAASFRIKDGIVRTVCEVGIGDIL
jgi:hypothetical protein